MYRNQKISLCMPCRNEAGNLPKILKKVPKIVDEIVLVSNCSTDDTVAVAGAQGCKVFEDNRAKGGIGYGYAHITAMHMASGDIIVAADSDGTYPIHQVKAVVDYLLDQKLDFISCNRYPVQAGSSIPLLLRLGVNVLNLEVALLYRLKIQDILSGMWVVRKCSLPLLELSEGDWNLSPQIKLQAATSPALRFGEFPISQTPRLGKSHQDYFRTGLRHIWWIAQNRIRGQFLERSSHIMPAIMEPRSINEP